jgi:flavin-dependent dehydrogenase
MNHGFDAIVVGARCAGSPTAMLLARQGYKVLVVDRASFPSDTVSTHLVHATAVSKLDRWGVLDEVIATGCPRIETYSFDFGPFTLEGTPRPYDGHSIGYAPRRTLLDKILVDAASHAGAEIREQFSVEEVLIEDGVVTGIRGHDVNGTSVTERARIVIGADGRNSHVARAVSPPMYSEKPALMQAFYTYWSGLPVSGVETTIRPSRGWGAIPTNDDLTLVVVGWPIAEASDYRADVEGNYLKTFELAPSFVERIRAAKREDRFYGAAVPNFFRKPYGPGWALVGDAGYCKDPITAQGILDAFRDAELCATAVDGALSGVRSFDDAMTAYQEARDPAVMGIYGFTTELAKLEPPPAELQHLLSAIAGSQDAMNEFVSVNTGAMSPMEFFDPNHIGELLGAAHA